MGTNVATVVLLLLSIVFRGENRDVGYWISLVVCACIGFFNNLCQLSFFAMINYFGMETVSRFTIGTAASGLMIIVVRAIVTGIFGADDQSNVAPIVIYFALAIGFNMFDLFLNFRLFSMREYIDKIETVNIKQDADSLISGDVAGDPV